MPQFPQLLGSLDAFRESMCITSILMVLGPTSSQAEILWNIFSASID